MTSAERETALLPIRIPIDRGLIGWRLILIRKDQAARWKQMTGMADIKAMTAGQGSDWPDARILRHSGLKVYGTTNYDSLFSLLESGRIDYFPRAVSEVWHEAERYQHSLAVAPGIALRYPAASYYFVRKDNAGLAAEIALGLERMLADGSFESLFNEYYSEVIRRSGLKERRIVELDNPMLPQGIPPERRHLLFRD